MKHFLLLSFCLAYFCKISAQGFSGSIEFRQITPKDTANNVYFVKGKTVKLDKYDKHSRDLEGSFIFDLNENKIRYTNPKRKIWGEFKSETAAVIRGVCEVSKGGNKKIAGARCTEYTVKNTEENTLITYWITDGKYTFFSPVIKLWNRKDKQSIYYLQIKGLPEGAMPFFSEEKQISDGKMINRLEVTKVVNKVPEDAAIAIPANYTKFE